MTKHKKLLFIIIGIIMIIIISTAGILYFQKPASIPVLPAQIKLSSNLEQPTDYLEPEGEIVLISRHVNYAWGYDDCGVFVDSTGNVYPFDFHAEYGGLSKSSNLVQKLDFIRRCTNPAGQITPSEMQDFIRLSRKIQNRDEYLSKQKMYDYGEHQLIFRDPDTGEQLLLGEWGDVDKTLKGLDASAAINKGKSIQEAVERTRATEQIVRVFVPEDVPFLDLPSQKTGRYLLRYTSQLAMLSEEISIPIDKIRQQLDQYDNDRYVYFVDLSATGNPTAIICRNGQFSIFTEGDSEPHCIVAAFPREAYPLMSVGCTDFPGNIWTWYEKGDPDYDPDVHKGLSYGISDEQIESVWDAFGMHQNQGVCLHSEKEYARFLQSCDANHLMEDGSSVRSLIEEDCVPDFEKYVLCVRISRRVEGMEFRFENVNLYNGMIGMGLYSDPPQLTNDKPRTDGVIGWLWLPKSYLQSGTDYLVV